MMPVKAPHKPNTAVPIIDPPSGPCQHRTGKIVLPDRPPDVPEEGTSAGHTALENIDMGDGRA